MCVRVQQHFSSLLSVCGAKCSNSLVKKVLVAVTGVSLVCVIAIALTLNWPNHHLTQGLTRHLGRGEKKMLIYVCVDDQVCAGWSDRQRSLVSMFLLALVTNRRFGILLQIPCDVRNFYMPNTYNWTVDEKNLEGRSQRLIFPDNNLSKVNFNQQYPEDILFARVNTDCLWKIKSNPHFKPLLPSWAKKKYHGSNFHDAWDILMKPTPRLQCRLDQMLNKVNFNNRTRPLVGVHVRTGRNPSNPYDGKVFNNLSSLTTLWKKVGAYVRNGSQLFLASDSEQVRQLSRERFGKAHHDTAGLILHVEKQRSDPRACQGFEEAILDQLILSYCDVLFRSRGGFSMRASFMNRPKSKVYIIDNGKVSP